jgi:hypothetical protein
LQSPADGSIVNTLNPTLQWQPPSSFGRGCPSNNNRVWVVLSSTCQSGSYTNVSGNLAPNTTSFTLSGLSWNTTYCWIVRASNGSKTTNSATFSFTTQQTSSLQSDSVLDDVCGNGIAGRLDQTNTSNPVTFRSSFSDPGGAAYVEARIAILPDFGPYAENRDIVDESTIESKALNAQSIVARYSNLTSEAYVLLNGGTWSAGQTTGTISNSTNTASLEDINGATITDVIGGTFNSQFRIKFENTFPSGDYNIYAMILYNNGTENSSYGSGGIYNYKKLSTSWKVDMDAPSASLSGPVEIGPSQFNMDWQASDTNGIKNIFSYIYSDTNGATIRDENIPLDIVTDGTEKTYPADTPNAGITVSNLGTHLYTDLTPGLNPQYIFRLYAEDNACNIAEVTQSATILSPWVLSYDNTISANAGFNSLFIPEVSNFTVPFTTDTSGPFLNNFGTISGNANTPALRNSKINATATNYNNSASTLPDDTSFTSWFEYLYDLVIKNNASTVINFDASANNLISGSMSQFFNILPNEKYVLFQTDYSEIEILSNTVCDIQALIFLHGDLTIHPDFTKANPDSACVFINLDPSSFMSIAQGTTKTNEPISSNNLSSYDIVEAGFLTHEFSAPLDAQASNMKWDGLYVFGFVYTTSLTLERDLNSVANNQQPAHVFRYDPTHFIVFQNDLAKRSFSIREIVD